MALAGVKEWRVGNDGMTEDSRVDNTQDAAMERQFARDQAARSLSFLVQPQWALGWSCHKAGRPQTSPQRL